MDNSALSRDRTGHKTQYILEEKEANPQKNEPKDRHKIAESFTIFPIPTTNEMYHAEENPFFIHSSRLDKLANLQSEE